MRQAVILVGGRGTRLGDLAKNTPKPLMPIDGDTRFLDYLIDNLARHGVQEVLLVAGHLGELVEERYQGARFRDCVVSCVREPEAAGTAGALLHVADRLDPVFLMSNGDSFFDFNYLALKPALGENDVAALALRRVDDARRYGAVFAEGGRVRRFEEKNPDANGPAWISGGVYLVRREILDLIKTSPCSIESDIFPQLAAADRLACANFDGYFLDIGLPDTLEQGRREMPVHTRRAAVFFDRDNTLNVDEGYTHRPQDLVWMPGAVEAVRAVNDSGRLAIVVTNQSGLARGLYDEAAMHAFHRHMQNELAAVGAHIDAFYFSPYHADAVVDDYRHADHPDRKPNPGMLKRACAEWAIDLDRSVMVGDQPSDVTAAEAMGVEGRLYGGGDLAALVVPRR